MLPELSLNILDVVQNSIVAKASLIKISVIADTKKDSLVITIWDNGCGMDSLQLSKVSDPFYTSRTTRRVGLGVPFFRMSAEITGGRFEITSKQNEGTSIKAEYVLSSIDRMPLGDINETIYQLIIFNQNIDFLYTYCVDNRQFILDTKDLKSILNGVAFDNIEVSSYIKEFLKENKNEVDKDVII